MEQIVLGLTASLLAGLATGVGALPVLLPINLTPRLQGIMLGFGGGVMLAATAFSLIIPGTEAAIAQGISKPLAALILSVGIVVGALFLEIANRYLPHEHFFKGPEGSSRENIKRIWLFIAAITLHNFPEGLAVGVGFGTGNTADGIALAVGIGLQNMPEGLVVAMALVAQKYSPLFALGISLLTGLVEPIGGLVGVGVISVGEALLPWGMGFAAGAMLFVVSDEIIPESHRQGLEREGTIGVILGFVIMMFLDISLS